MTVLAVIPARGGSKGIPRKNIRLLAGRPLIVWTIDAARAAPGIDRIVVSTDDAEIADVARAAGADVPFMRPEALAQDTTPGLDPVLHALAEVPGHATVVLLQPTSPLRTAADIGACLALAARAPSVVSLREARDHPWLTYAPGEGGHLRPLHDGPPPARRQDLPVALALNGAVYVADVAWLTHGRRFVGPETLGHVMPPERSVDIDTPFDWTVAEALLAAR